MTAILTALKQELMEITRSLKNAKTEMWGRVKISNGILDGKPVVAAASGVGKAMSSIIAQRIVDLYKPDCLIYAGIAGSLNPDLAPGDVVLAKDSVFWDLDVTGAGFKRGVIPFAGYRFIKSDGNLLQKALRCQIPGKKIVAGRVLTGDSFITGKNRSLFDEARKGLSGDAVDMEGASAALTAAVNGIPFLLIRVISDKADGVMPANFLRFLRDSSATCLTVVRAVIA